MRILMVLDHSFPPDIRVENEARSLVAAGFNVAILAIGPDHRLAEDTFHGIRIFRDPMPKRLRNWMRGLAGTFNWPRHLLASRIRGVARHWPFDVLHLHDLYLFGGGLQAARTLGVQVVGDLHENWVEALKHYQWSSTFPGKYLVSQRRWQRLEHEWVNAVDRLIVVVEEAAVRNLALGVPAERLVAVPNTVKIDDFRAYPIDHRLVDSIRRPFTVVYTGGMDLHRGLDTVIMAMPAVAAERTDVRLLLVGDGRIRPSLEALAAHLGVAEHVHFVGWRPQSTIRSYIEAADVCLVPHRRSVHTDATLPHKLFHYMLSRKPVVVTNCRPLERIVSEERCGLVVEDGDADAMASAILAIGADPELAADMAKRGREAVLARWNWDATTGPLIEAYRSLAAERAR